MNTMKNLSRLNQGLVDLPVAPRANKILLESPPIIMEVVSVEPPWWEAQRYRILGVGRGLVFRHSCYWICP
jgi:hypothetical protein